MCDNGHCRDGTLAGGLKNISDQIKLSERECETPETHDNPESLGVVEREDDYNS